MGKFSEGCLGQNYLKQYHWKVTQIQQQGMGKINWNIHRLMYNVAMKCYVLEHLKPF